MMSSYIQFCLQYKRQPINPTVDTLLAYLEHLTARLKSPKSIQNYWSSVKLVHTLLKLPFHNAKDIQITLMLRAISLTKRHVSKQKQPITVQQLGQMADILDKQGPAGLVIKTAILLGFAAFLRASNLCPEQANGFDPTRNFARRDIKFTEHGLMLALKWAKNMQTSLQPTQIHIPHMTPVKIDPVQSYKIMITLIPAPPHQPIFMLPNNQVLTVTKLRSTFQALCIDIGIDPEEYSLHSLRRGGPSHANLQGATPKDIQRHGFSSSDSYWNYIAPQPDKHSTVFQALQS